MSIFRLGDINFEYFELSTNPFRTFSSSSSGVTGSVALFADNSSVIKDVFSTNDSSGFFNEETVEVTRANLDNNVASGTSTQSTAQQYLDVVHSVKQTVRASKRQEVIRSKPGARFNKNFFKKNAVRASLFPYYKHLYPTLDWAFTNYNCINFVTGGNLPADSVFIYPAGTGSVEGEDVNFLAPSSSFSFEFWINPRYTQETENVAFTAGTILHMSSCYAISLVTGSRQHDGDGKKDGYRILLQLSQSAEIPPSDISLSGDTISVADAATADSSLIFASSDNSLERNHWHYVGIRWGGSNFNNGTGSFIIDGRTDTNFVVTSSTCMQSSLPVGSSGDPDGLFIGNFYEGTNVGDDQIAAFFNTTAATNEGVTNFNKNLDSDIGDPTATFDHPLNAEIHDIKIYEEARSVKQMKASMADGSEITSKMLFYLPPFFVKESRKRNILQTPFFESAGITEDPFNIPLSFGLGGLSINLENYMRDFVRKEYPRMLSLSASSINTAAQETGRDANHLLYLSGSNRKRNLTIIPCDNGKFFPNFELLASGTAVVSPVSGSSEDKFVDDYGNRRLGQVSLNNLVGLSLMPAYTEKGERDTGKIYESADTGEPEDIDPSVAPGNILTILQRTRDPSSNEVAIFDISNMFYGDRIVPETLTIKDTAVTGSDGAMTFMLKDDGKGSLYRADGATKHALWANVGNVIYEEGIVVIKTPNLPLFGKDSFEISFQGERNIYVLEVTVPAERSMFDESKNPAYQALKPTDYASEIAEKFSYLTGMMLHDDNLNVVMRVNFAQPIVKRVEDRIVVRARLDF